MHMFTLLSADHMCNITFDIIYLRGENEYIGFKLLCTWGGGVYFPPPLFLLSLFNGKL